MAGTPGVSKLRIYAYESAKPAYRIVFSHTRFLEVEVGDDLLAATHKGMVDSLLASGRSNYRVTSNPFKTSTLEGTCTSIKSNQPLGGGGSFECYAFATKDSVWLINFMAPSADGLKTLAEKIMSDITVD